MRRACLNVPIATNFVRPIIFVLIADILPAVSTCSPSRRNSRRMPERVTIAVDGMGGDFAPKNVVDGCVQAVSELNVRVKLVGRKDQLQSELEKHKYPGDRIEVLHG